VLLDGRDTLDMMTSAGFTKRFVTHGIILIERDGRLDSLYSYVRIWPEGQESAYDPHLFVPFTDHTTGVESYGGGRYLDLPIPTEGVAELIVDFNRCYNPYCAYGDGFSCPIPPRKNDLDFSVRAGERDYGKH
jgi:hypothetical protein